MKYIKLVISQTLIGVALLMFMVAKTIELLPRLIIMITTLVIKIVEKIVDDDLPEKKEEPCL